MFNRVFVFLMCSVLLAGRTCSAQAVHSRALVKKHNKLASNTAVMQGLPRIDYGKVPHPNFNDLPSTSDGRKMMAKVNGEVISVEQYRVEFRNMMVENPNSSAEFRNALEAGAEDYILQILIGKAVVRQYAAEQNLTVTDEEVERSIRARNQYRQPGHKLQDDYIARGQPVSDLRELIRYQILRDKVENFLGESVTTPTAEQLSDFRRLNSSRIRQTTETHAAHIAFRALDNSSTQTIAQARRNAENVLQEIRAGMPFETAARKYSEDRTTIRAGGDLGWFSAGKMYPEFDRAIAKLKPGEVSGVVRSPVGFHIIKVYSREPDNALALYMEDARHRAFRQWQMGQIAAAHVEKFAR
jgi:parvulin-like peptidyl-prolyl isomerase